MSGNATLELQDVVAEYFPGQPILDGLSIAPPIGEVCVIIGPNGSGKSTALRVMAGFLQPVSGSVIRRDGEGETDISDRPAHQRSSDGVSYLPQGHSVFPSMSVHDNLLLGGWPVRADRARVRAAVAEMYQRYPALEQKRDALAGSLSGGQQRILELARALVPDPRILLVDEPSAGVAPSVAEVMYRELQSLRSEGRTIVLVDQDIRAALAIADTVCVLRAGRIDRSGQASEFGDDLDALVRDWLAVDPPAASARTPQPFSTNGATS